MTAHAAHAGPATSALSVLDTALCMLDCCGRLANVDPLADTLDEGGRSMVSMSAALRVEHGPRLASLLPAKARRRARRAAAPCITEGTPR